MNPIENEAVDWGASNKGHIALMEMLTRKFGTLSPEMEKLAQKYPTYLYNQKTFDEEIAPQYRSSLYDQKDSDAFNVGYAPQNMDKLTIGDDPEIGAIYANQKSDLGNVLPHEFIHRYQYEHPLTSGAFMREAQKSGDLKGLLSFILGRYFTGIPDEMMAYTTEGKIPENLKRFYGSLIGR